MAAPGKLMAFCPYCSSGVWLDRWINVWDTLACNQCATPLQVLALNPPELDYYLEDEWEDDEEFETLEDYHALDSDSVEPLDFEDVGKGNGSHGDGH